MILGNVFDGDFFLPEPWTSLYSQRITNLSRRQSPIPKSEVIKYFCNKRKLGTKMTTTVAVTGGTGFLASRLVKILLEKNIRVHSTVRSINSQKSAQLKALPNGVNNLVLFECDLENGDFAAAFAGCSAVFHVASPVTFTAPDVFKEIIDPTIRGVKNVLNAIEKTSSVKQFIFSSSIAAALDMMTLDSSKIYDENDWNTTSTPQTNAYRYAKTQAEREVWSWAEKHKHVSVSTILPTFIVGVPLINPSSIDDMNMSLKPFLGYLSGKITKGVRGSLGMVGVEDVAIAHYLAFEKPEKSTNQRFICSGSTSSWVDVCQILKKEFPQFANKIAVEGETNDLLVPATKEGQKLQINTSKITNILGMKFTPLENILKQVGDYFIQQKLV